MRYVRAPPNGEVNWPRLTIRPTCSVAYGEPHPVGGDCSGHHCFDHVVSNGYLSALTRPEHAVCNNSSGKSWASVPSTKEVLKQRTDDYHQGRLLRLEEPDPVE